jgi:molybdate transport system ATP-binding protein
VSGLDAQVRASRGPLVVEARVAAAAGEVLAVVGPNGAGKTTLLRALAGLLALDAGYVRLSDRDLSRLPPQERRIGVVFQEARLFPHLSVLANVAFGPRSRGRRDATAVASRCLASLGIEALAGRRPAELSGGQAQRVALARALATQPELLLLDEPLAAVDVAARPALRAELRSSLRSFGGPSLLVTHDPIEAMTVADRLLVLEHGRVVQEGDPAEVARRPATPYVGHLVGLNVFRGRAGAGVLTTDDGAQVHLAGGLAGEVVAAVAPSAVTLHVAEPRSSARNTWRCTVAEVEPYADRVRVTLAGQIGLRADITVAALADLRLLPGQTVWATVKAVEVVAYPDVTAARAPR